MFIHARQPNNMDITFPILITRRSDHTYINTHLQQPDGYKTSLKLYNENHNKKFLSSWRRNLTRIELQRMSSRRRNVIRIELRRMSCYEKLIRIYWRHMITCRKQIRLYTLHRDNIEILKFKLLYLWFQQSFTHSRSF